MHVLPSEHYHLPLIPPCADLDWGDFFFNLISMCIVYAYFSEAAVAGESQAAIVVSMCIAAIDIVLLALRWLWCVGKGWGVGEGWGGWVSMGVAINIVLLVLRWLMRSRSARVVAVWVEWDVWAVVGGGGWSVAWEHWVSASFVLFSLPLHFTQRLRRRPPARRYEQYITYGGAVLQVFQMYRLVVLPVANTWMSWSLLNKLGIAPSTLVVAATGLAVLALIVAGVQVGRHLGVV